MRILILSDLHLEFDSSLQIPRSARPDVVVLAGDIWSDDGAVTWAGEQFDCPVVFVAGNHEYYDREMNAVRRHIARSCRDTRVHFLDDRQVVIDGVRFLGSTLWTDFELGGDKVRALQAAQAGMTDFRLIRVDERAGDGARLLTAADTATLHAQGRLFLERELAARHDGPTVVVTHHLPSPRSVAPRWAGYLLNAAFASDLDELIERHRPALWIHGHTHDSCDYQLGDTRVVCNPRGYVPHEPNPRFDPGLVISL